MRSPTSGPRPRPTPAPSGESQDGSTIGIAGDLVLVFEHVFDVHMADMATHTVSLYAVDYDFDLTNVHSERIDLIDNVTGNVLNTRTLSGFQNGVYLTWNVTGNVRIVVTNLNPATNAVASGLFFGTG